MRSAFIVSKHDRVALLEQIERIYRMAGERADVEDAELDHHDPAIRAMPPLKHGMQVHLPYTAYAHWMLLRRTLKSAGVRRRQRRDLRSKRKPPGTLAMGAR